jgi:GAF domain-containing protein
MSKTRILLVDDDLYYRKSLVAFLTNANFEVDACQNSLEAISKLRENNQGYQIVLLDWSLKTADESGQVMEKSKALNPYLPIIVFTGDPHEGGAAALQRGASWYLRKPFSLQELENTVRNILAQDGIFRQMAESTRDIMAIDQCLIWRYYEKADQFRLAGWADPSTMHEKDKVAILKADKPRVRRVLRSKFPSFIKNIKSNSSQYHSQEFFKRHKWHSLIALPMRHKGELIGLLEMYIANDSALLDEPQERVERRAQVFADHVTESIYNAEQAVKNQELINSISSLSAEQPSLDALADAILTKARNLVEAEVGMFYMRNFGQDCLSALGHQDQERTGFSKRISMQEENLATLAVNQGALQVIEDTREPGKAKSLSSRKFRSQIAIPLKRGELVVGVLALASKLSSAFSVGDLALMRSFASLAGSVLDQVKLQFHLQQISQAVLKGHEVLQDVVIQAIHELLGKSVALWLWNDEITEFTVPAAKGVSEEFKKKAHIKYTGVDDSLIAHAFLTRKPINCADMAHPPKGLTVMLNDLLREEKWISTLIVPIFDSEEQPIGAIAIKRETIGVFTRYEEDFLSNFASQVAIAFENHRRRQNLARQLAAFQDVIGVVGFIEKEPLPIILKNVAELLKADYGSIVLLDREKNRLENKALWIQGEILSGNQIPDKKRFQELVTGIVGHVADGNCDEYYAPDLTKNDPYYLPWNEETISEYAVALKDTQNNILGVLNLESALRDAFSESKQELCRSLAGVASAAIQQSILLDAIQSHFLTEPHELRELLDQVLRNLNKMMGANTASSINLYDDVKDKFYSYYGVGPDLKFVNKYLLVAPRNKGTGRYVLKTKQPLYYDDVNRIPKGFPRIRKEARDQEIRSFAVLPLIYQKKILGALFIHKIKEQTKFTENTRRLLELYANQAAFAIYGVKHHTDIEPLKEIMYATIKKDEADILNLIAKQTVRIMSSDYASIWLYDSKNDGLVSEARYVKPDERKYLIKGKYSLKSNQGSINMLVFRSGKSMIVDDVSVEEKAQRYNRIYEKAQSEIAVPLKFRNEIIGTLNTESQHLAAFSEFEEKTMFVVADIAAIAIKTTRAREEIKQKNDELARRTEEIRKQNEELGKRGDDLVQMNYRLERKNASFEALTEIGQQLTANVQYGEQQILSIIHKQASRIMDTGNMYIALYEPEKDEVRFELAFIDGTPVDVQNEQKWAPRPGGNGRTEWIIRNKKPILTYTKTEAEDWYKQPDVENYIGQTFASWLGVPIMFGEEVLGVIATYHKTEEYKYAPDDEKILSLMGRQAAIALQNARLISKLDTMRELGEDLSSALSV